MGETTNTLPVYTVELDAADLDVLYTLAGGPHDAAVARRLGHGIQQRTFDRLHAQLPQSFPWPGDIRRALRAEGRYAVADEVESGV